MQKIITMTINYQELKNQAKSQDCCNFLKRNRVKLPKNKYESFDLDSFNDERLQFNTLSKQDKIKLVSKNYY